MSFLSILRNAQDGILVGLYVAPFHSHLQLLTFGAVLDLLMTLQLRYVADLLIGRQLLGNLILE